MSSLHDELAAPFDADELKFFPVAKSKDGKTARAAAFIDARAVMDRLDSAPSVGPGNWRTSYRVIDQVAKAVECTLTIKEDGEWVDKADVGYPNEARDADNADKEPWKAAYSDALKRAAVQWGIGRYIYSLKLERDWLPVDEYGKFTEQPRIKGATRQASEALTASAPAATPPEPQPVTATKQSGLYEIAAQMGFGRDEVIAASQKHFDNREPAKLTGAEKQNLIRLMEEDKKKELISVGS